MPFHRCAVSTEDGRVVAKEVTVMIEETQPQGDAWYGTISATHQMPLEPGKRYRLMLDDGRAGEFTVRRNTFAGDTNRSVAIHGQGPLRQSAG